MILGLAERFGQPPHEVASWDAEVWRLLNIEAAGRPEEGAERGRQ